MKTNDIAKILEKHIDQYCGKNPSGFFKEENLRLNVARFRNVPDNGLSTYISIGMCLHGLKQNVSGIKIRQELLFCVADKYDHLPWHEIIFSVGSKILQDHNAVMLGQVIGPWGPLFPELHISNLTALICSYPAFFDEDFCEIELKKEDGPIVFVELIPITTKEANFISNDGWSAFFEKIDNCEIDILDLERK